MKGKITSLCALTVLLFFSCEQDPVIIKVESEQVKKVSASFTLKGGETELAGTFKTILPALSAEEMAAEEEMTVDGVLSLDENQYVSTLLYYPEDAFIVGQVDVDAYTYDFNGTISDTIFSGQITQFVSGSDPLEITDSADLTGTVEAIERSLLHE